MRQQCTRFHEQYPEVWDLFIRFTFEMINKGFKNYSAQHGIFARIRWEMDAGGNDVNQFKINNNYSAFYARRFMEMYPQHDGFFRTRQQTSEDRSATNFPELTPEYYEYLQASDQKTEKYYDQQRGA
tara:strand:- start:320 stop:700 length:381 start_codon:yes stop_codon:yes gene_type:complete